MKKQWTWGEFLLPSWKPKQWTWRMIFLLSVASFSFIDSLFIPISRNVDPGRSGEGVVFLILGFRAVSRSGLPISVVAAGTCLAALTAGLNHGLIKSPSLLWTPIALLLAVVVMFWGRRAPHEP